MLVPIGILLTAIALLTVLFFRSYRISPRFRAATGGNSAFAKLSAADDKIGVVTKQLAVKKEQLANAHNDLDELHKGLGD